MQSDYRLGQPKPARNWKHDPAIRQGRPKDKEALAGREQGAGGRGWTRLHKGTVEPSSH